MKKRHVMDLQIEIPDSDEEKKQQQIALQKIKKMKEA